MINNFWAWITQTTQLALDTINNFVFNSTTGPFMDLLLVVILMAALMHFIIKPLIGFSISAGKSDKVKYEGNKEGNKEENG